MTPTNTKVLYAKTHDGLQQKINALGAIIVVHQTLVTHKSQTDKPILVCMLTYRPYISEQDLKNAVIL